MGMNNEELKTRFSELLGKDNCLDMIEGIFDFEKEYKTSEFYKHTKMPIFDTIKYFKIWNLLNLKDVQKTLQDFIDGLDFKKLINLMEQLGSVFAQENSDIMSEIQSFRDTYSDTGLKDIVNNLKN